MLTITDLVNKYDPQNQFEVLINSYKQIEFAWNNQLQLSSLKKKKFNSVVVTGLGGSAISADLIQNFLVSDLKIPLIVNRNYSLPNFFDDKTLLVVSSYSGNTEETVSVFKNALKVPFKGPASVGHSNILCITTGGKIEKIAAKNNIPVVKVLKGYQPRYSLALSFFTLLKVLQTLNIIDDQSGFVNKIIKLWKRNGEEFSVENNIAVKYAERIIGKIPVIYSAADVTSAVGYRFKCQFNENSKLHAFANQIPELNHNEIVGWESFSEKNMSAILLNILDKNYNSQVTKRFKVTSGVATTKGIEIINFESVQKDFKVRKK